MENVHQLRVFLAVAHALSFTRAAEQLFLTQSAVSHQIGGLEKELGCRLFERSGKRVALTAAGRALVIQSQKVLGTLDAALDAVKQAGQLTVGSIRVGASVTACQYIIPEALREFRECFPDYSVTIIPADSPVSYEHVMNGAVDVAIMLRTETSRRVAFHPLFTDELQLIVSPLHPWAKTGKVDRAQLPQQRMILYSRSSATFRVIEKYFTRIQVPIRNWMEVGDLGAIKELVKLGLGVSVVAPWVSAREIEEGSLVSLSLHSAQLRRHWCIAALAGRKLSLAEQTFIKLCQAATKRLSRATA